jgi:hypothetical protein
MPSSHVVLDQVDITFDDQRSVALAGLLLPATLAEWLGIEQATDQLLDLGGRPGPVRPAASCSPWSMRGRRRAAHRDFDAPTAPLRPTAAAAARSMEARWHRDAFFMRYAATQPDPRHEDDQRFRWSWRCGGPARTCTWDLILIS